MMNGLITLLLFILILGVIILVHEFGHFIFSKKFGVYVHEFAIGMGPKIFSRKKKETEYSIRAVPIGGFCSLAGEDGEETDDKGKKIPKNRKLFAKPIWQRLLILFFGAGNNFILAYILLFLAALISGAPTMDPVISGVTENYPVAEAGITEGSKILEVNGHKTKTIDDVQLYITLNKEGTPLDLKIESTIDEDTTQIKKYTIEPIKVKEKVENKEVEVYRYGLEFKTEKIERGFLPALRYSFQKAGAIFRQMFVVIGNLFTGGVSINSLSGPVGIYSYVGEVKQQGYVNLLLLTALLSINVGVLNLIPFPAFDGGRIFLLLIEKLRGKPVKPETENLINTVGFILIMILAIYVTGHDIFTLLFK